MKRDLAHRLILEAWEDWAQRRGLDNSNATGRDTLQFFHELQDAKSPLLNFGIRRRRDHWQTIHGWLVQAGRVRN